MINITSTTQRIWSDAPTIALPTHFPTISMPSCCARALVVRMQSAAPSPMPLAFPAVVDAGLQSGKTGFKADKLSMVTPERMVSSTEMTVPRISIGRISSANTPRARACLEVFSSHHVFPYISSHTVPDWHGYAKSGRIRLVSDERCGMSERQSQRSTPWAMTSLVKTRMTTAI